MLLEHGRENGRLAQLVERLHHMEEVEGSNPLIAHIFLSVILEHSRDKPKSTTAHFDFPSVNLIANG